MSRALFDPDEFSAEAIAELICDIADALRAEEAHSNPFKAYGAKTLELTTENLRQHVRRLVEVIDKAPREGDRASGREALSRVLCDVFQIGASGAYPDEEKERVVGKLNAVARAGQAAKVSKQQRIVRSVMAGNPGLHAKELLVCVNRALRDAGEDEMGQRNLYRLKKKWAVPQE